MTVVLQETYKNDLFVNQLNDELTEQYGANTGIKFNTWQYLQQEAHYINHHPQGLKELIHYPRPVSIATLSADFFWYRVGEFSFKLSGEFSADEARSAVAVCKWLIKTNGKYIDKKQSENYCLSIAQQYLNHVFQEEGYDLNEVWRII